MPAKSCTIYHNPRCSKSRATLALLQAEGIDPKVVEYLSAPPNRAELKAILERLKLRPIDLLRQSEDEFKALVAGKDLTDAQLIDIMVAHPILIERPIVVNGERAAIGRPPESVLKVFK